MINLNTKYQWEKLHVQSTHSSDVESGAAQSSGKALSGVTHITTSKQTKISSAQFDPNNQLIHFYFK